jgi:hypothetical protein
MTHVHTYNVQDLWAFFTCEGMSAEGFRVVLGPDRAGLIGALRSSVVHYAKRKILGCDFANNIALIARKP